jgi:hypothetical protein
VAVRWDNTVRYNLAVRTEGKDPKIANAPNTDESDNKFDRGDVVNNRIDLLSELDLVYKSRMGLRVSGAAWYDHGYRDEAVKTAPGWKRGAATTTTPTPRSRGATTRARPARSSTPSCSATSTSAAPRCA